MKKSLKFGAIALGAAIAAIGFTACSEPQTVEKITIVKDPNPYTFDNSDNRPHAEYDAGMKIDGKFDEEKWEHVDWLHGEDKPNAAQSAKIDFTGFVGEKGIFFGAKVEETGTNIYVNPERGSWTNSCLELYVGPIGQTDNRKKTIEMDIQADGTTDNMRLKDSERDLKTTWDIMPVIAAQQIGGKVNTPECTGYAIECFVPWAYLKLADWDVTDTQNLKVGIDPVHIFSLKFEGEDVSANVTETRIWSRWSEKVLPGLGWLAPDTFFRFDDGGLMTCKYNVNYSGTGKGTVAAKSGNDFVYGWGTSTFTVKPKNGATVTSLRVNGEEYTGTAKFRDNGGTYEFDVKDPTGDITIDVVFEG